jgi:hypothetical protein
LLQKVIKTYQWMAQKVSCMRTEDVHVPPAPSQGPQTRTRQRVAIDIPESSRARCTDEDDDDDGYDDDISDIQHTNKTN